MIASKFGISSEYDFYLELGVIPLSVAAVVTYAIFYAYTPYYAKIKQQKGNKEAVKELSMISMKWSFVVLLFLGIATFSHLNLKFGLGLYEINNEDLKWKVLLIIIPITLAAVLQCCISFLSISNNA